MELKLFDAQVNLKKEAEDVLRIVETMDEKTLNVEIEKYAQKNGITSLEARARTLQYISPEWKKKIDAEVREFFTKESVMDLVLQSQSKENWRVIENLFDEGYSAQLTTTVRFSKKDLVERAEKLHVTEQILEQIQKDFEKTKKLSPDEKIKMMFTKYLPDVEFQQFVAKLEHKDEKDLTEDDLAKYTNHNFLPEAKKEFQKLLQNPDRKKTIELFFKTWFFGREIEKQDNLLGNFDCDEESLFNQKLGLLTQSEIHGYVESDRHVSLKINGFEIFYDTFDQRFRTRDEFGKRDEYGHRHRPSYYLRDINGTSFAEYDDQKNVIGYKQAEEGSNRAFKHKNIAELFLAEISTYEEHDSKKAELLYRSLLQQYPNFSEGHGNFAVFLGEVGKSDEAEKHYRIALDVNSNLADAYFGLANLLRKKNDTQSAILYYRESMCINPNHIDTIKKLGILLFQEGGNMEEVLDLFERALSLETDKDRINELNIIIQQLKSILGD